MKSRNGAPLDADVEECIGQYFATIKAIHQRLKRLGDLEKAFSRIDELVTNTSDQDVDNPDPELAKEHDGIVGEIFSMVEGLKT